MDILSPESRSYAKDAITIATKEVLPGILEEQTLLMIITGVLGAPEPQEEMT